MRKVIKASLSTAHEIRGNPRLHRRIEIEKELRTSSSAGWNIMKAIKEFRYDQVPTTLLKRVVGEYSDLSYFYNALFMFGRMGDPFTQIPLYSNYEIVTTEYLNDLYTGKLKVKDELIRLDPDFSDRIKQKGTDTQKSISNLLSIDSVDNINNINRKIINDIENQEPKHDTDESPIEFPNDQPTVSKVEDDIPVLESKTQKLYNNNNDSHAGLSISSHISNNKNQHSKTHTAIDNCTNETINHVVSPMEDDTELSEQGTLTKTSLNNRQVGENKLSALDGVKKSPANNLVNEEPVERATDTSIVSINVGIQPGAKKTSDQKDEPLPTVIAPNEQHTKLTNDRNAAISNKFISKLDKPIDGTVLYNVESGRITEPIRVVNTTEENRDKITESITAKQHVHEESKKSNNREACPVLSDASMVNDNNNDVSHLVDSVSIVEIPRNIIEENNRHPERLVEDNNEKLGSGLIVAASRQTDTIDKKRKAEDNLEKEPKKLAIVDEQDSVLGNIKNSTMAFQSLLGDMRRVNTAIGNEREQDPDIDANESYSYSYDTSNSESRRNSYADDEEYWSDKQDDQALQNTDNNNSVIEADSNSESDNIEIERLPKALKRMNDLAKKYGLYE